jgi:flavorubredoxin
MDTRLDEIAARVFRISTHVLAGPPGGITHNQFVIAAEQPLLFHAGLPSLFTRVHDAIARILDPTTLRWISSCHASRPDEYGALDRWLDVAPRAEATHGRVGCLLCLGELATRPPRVLADGEVVDIGGARVRWIDTPHVPGPWEAGVLFDEASRTLFCGDIFSRSGPAESITSSDIVAAAIAHDQRMHGNAVTIHTAATLRRLAALRPERLALMHGPTFVGDGGAALEGLAQYFDELVRARE